MDVLGGLESGQKFRLEVPGLGYGVDIPCTVLPSGDRRLRIASLNLVGQTRLNRDLGRLLAARMQEVFPDLQGLVCLKAVEKALMLVQAVAQEVDLEEVAAHLNRPLPAIRAVFCVAREGKLQTLPAYPVHCLTRLPDPPEGQAGYPAHPRTGRALRPCRRTRSARKGVVHGRAPAGGNPQAPAPPGGHPDLRRAHRRPDPH